MYNMKLSELSVYRKRQNRPICGPDLAPIPGRPPRLRLPLPASKRRHESRDRAGARWRGPLLRPVGLPDHAAILPRPGTGGVPLGRVLPPPRGAHPPALLHGVHTESVSRERRVVVRRPMARVDAHAGALRRVPAPVRDPDVLVADRGGVLLRDGTPGVPGHRGGAATRSAPAAAGGRGRPRRPDRPLDRKSVV